MKWEEYIKGVLETKTAFDDLPLSSAGEAMSISPIVKASVLMLESELQAGSIHNVFVFPDTQDLVYEFLIAKTVYNITVGKIKYSYDPHLFKKGQKLSYKNKVVVFEKCEIDKKDHRERICISFSDGMKYYLPIEIAPMFQLADSKRVSKYQSFSKIYNAKTAIAEAQCATPPSVSKILSDYKTHLNGSILFVSKIKSSNDFFTKCEIDSQSISHFLYVGRANYDGKVSNVFPGQMKGNPAIIIAPDLYSVAAAIEKGISVQSVIIDLSGGNYLDSQLDVLDDLSERAFPIACVCDTNSSFSLDLLQEREFSIWRWDKTNIICPLLHSASRKTSAALENCYGYKAEYIVVNNDKLSECIRILNSYKNSIYDMQNEAVYVHGKLFSLSVGMLRSINPSDYEDRAIDSLLQCIDKLESVKKYISEQCFTDFNKVITTLDSCIRHRFSNPKFIKLKDIILSGQYKSICLVISSKFDKQKTEKYWNEFIREKQPDVNIIVMYPEEYISEYMNADVTVFSGWLGKKLMKNMLFSYKTKINIILEYQCEKYWEKSHNRNYQKALSNSGNINAIEKYIKSDLEVPELSDGVSTVTYDQNTDELDEIELFIRENKYRQYSSASPAERIIEAVPVSFIGGYISFFGQNHSVISVTKIISQESDKIEIIKHPQKLSVGDFIAIRESDRDIITEMADQILDRNGKNNLRSIVNRWKEALELEAYFTSEEEICEKIKAAGCSKSEATIRNWINNSSAYIAPNSKEDLICIAVATEDGILLDTVEEVFEAAQVIKGAHQQAGMLLSKIVKIRISEELHLLRSIDVFNIWDPIEIEIENVGKIKILKIIDIGEPVSIGSNTVNRLIEE